MSILLFNVLIAGLKDGYSSTMIMAAGLIMVLYIYGWRRGYKVNWFVGWFIFELMLFGFFAHLDAITYNPYRIFSLLHDVLAGLLFVIGVKLFLNWIAKKQAVSLAPTPLKLWQRSLLSLVIAVCALTLVIADVRYPMDPYMVALSNNIFAKVAGVISILALCLYTILKFWMVWVVVIVFLSSRIEKNFKIILAAAFCLASGLSIFYLR